MDDLTGSWNDDPWGDDQHVKSLTERLAEIFHRRWRRGVMRSGMVTLLALAVLTIGFVLIYRQHMQGNFHKLRERMTEQRPQIAAPRPGGQDAIVLSRTRMMEDSLPEFLSVTMLPGRGMNTLQIRAYIPGRGEVDLMASSSLEDAARQMTGERNDAHGEQSLAMGGAFEVPWAGDLLSHERETDGPIEPIWRGNRISLAPTGNTDGIATAAGGLILTAAADQYTSVDLPDGEQAQATYHGFGDRWPSKVMVRVSALLSSHTLDLTVTATNTGDVAEPLGIGWSPRFALQNGTANVKLRVAGQSQVEMHGRDSPIPTGRLIPVTGTAYDFSGLDGAKIPSGGMDVYFSGLQQGLLDNGPETDISDPSGGYRIRLTALSNSIQAVHVRVPADGSYISVSPQLNFPDPLGSEWHDAGKAGMAILEPGQSTTWKVRVEILPTTDSAGGL